MKIYLLNNETILVFHPQAPPYAQLPGRGQSGEKILFFWCKAHGSAGKESTCNAGGPSSIPGSERSPGEGTGYPLQYSRASLAAQLVENLPAVQETWVRFLGQKDPLEKGMVIHSSILVWRIPMGKVTWQATVHVVKKSLT